MWRPAWIFSHSANLRFEKITLVSEPFWSSVVYLTDLHVHSRFSFYRKRPYFHQCMITNRFLSTQISFNFRKRLSTLESQTPYLGSYPHIRGVIDRVVANGVPRLKMSFISILGPLLQGAIYGPARRKREDLKSRSSISEMIDITNSLNGRTRSHTKVFWSPSMRSQFPNYSNVVGPSNIKKETRLKSTGDWG